MSACSFCCSFIGWFKQFLFNLFFVESLSFWCRGWSGILFIFFCMDENFGLSPALKWFNSNGLLHFSYGCGLHATKDCPQADVLNFVQFFGVCLSCCHPGTGHIFQRLFPCRRFLESWSWYPSVFQTISSGQQTSWCLFYPEKVGVSTWGCVLSPSFMATFSLEVEREKTVSVSSLH